MINDLASEENLNFNIIYDHSVQLLFEEFMAPRYTCSLLQHKTSLIPIENDEHSSKIFFCHPVDSMYLYYTVFYDYIILECVKQFVITLSE